jgi:hypothetical protein
MSELSVSDRIELAEVLNLSNEEAIHWLKQNTYESPPGWLGDALKQKRDIASFCFARRNDFKLNLAVARYGSHIATIKKLFSSGGTSIRLSVLSNALIGPYSSPVIFGQGSTIFTPDDALKVVNKFPLNEYEFTALFQNPNLDRDWVSEFLESRKNDNKYISDDAFLHIVYILAENPMIQKVYDDTFMDGYDEYKFGRLTHELIDLLQTAPVDGNWAHVLTKLLPKVNLPYVPDFEENILERWTDVEGEKASDLHSFPYLREEITHRLIMKSHKDSIRNLATINHKDKAVRLGFYSSVNPSDLFNNVIYKRDFSYPNFNYLESDELTTDQKVVVKICKKCFKKDGNDFVDRLLRNNHFWETRQTRELLHDLSWNLAEDEHSDMDMPNIYRAIEQMQIKNSPSYFKDDEFVETPFAETTEGRIELISDQIETLGTKIDTLASGELVDDFGNRVDVFSSEVRESIGELHESMSISNLSKKLNALEGRIGRIKMWLWAIFILLVLVLLK